MFVKCGAVVKDGAWEYIQLETYKSLSLLNEEYIRYLKMETEPNFLFLEGLSSVINSALDGYDLMIFIDTEKYLSLDINRDEGLTTFIKIISRDNEIEKILNGN